MDPSSFNGSADERRLPAAASGRMNVMRRGR
jgi:hypothetical protein